MNVKKTVIKEKAYLYSLWKSEKLMCFEGKIEECINDKGYSYRLGRNEYSNPYGLFTANKKPVRSRSHNSYECSLEEGLIWNNMLWLSQRDDKKAAGIFIEYQEEMLEELMKRVKAYQAKIDMLKEV